MAGNKDFQFISYSAEGGYFLQKQIMIIIIIIIIYAFELGLIGINAAAKFQKWVDRIHFSKVEYSRALRGFVLFS